MPVKGERWAKEYVLEERMTPGGMAQVWRARRIGAAGFSKQVCIKYIHEHLAHDAHMVSMFEEEARLSAKLQHRNIVSIDAFVEHEERRFIAMEFVNGVNLAALEQAAAVEGIAIAPDVAAFIAVEVLNALHAAHNARDPVEREPLRVIHRDVSPHNILVSYGAEVKLTDFGIARAEGQWRGTDQGKVLGKFGYMPLEQINGETLDARTDLFALGVVLFELLSGRRPFRGDGETQSPQSIMYAQINNERPSLAALRPDVPAPFVAMVHRLLEPKPEDRFDSAASALDALQSLPEINTGGMSLSALMSSLYPSHASAVYVPRASLPPAIERTDGTPTDVARHASTPPSPPVDAFAETRRRPRLHVVSDTDPDLQSSPPIQSTLSGATASAPLPSRRATGWVIAGSIAASAAIAFVVPKLRRTPDAAPIAHALAPVVRPVTAAAPPNNAAAEDPPVPAARIAPDPTPTPIAAPAVQPPAPRVITGLRPGARVAVHPVAVASSAASGSAMNRTPVPAVTPPSTPATAVAPAPAPVAEAVVTGRIRIVAFPWAETFVDGHPYGRAPQVVPLSPGSHTVRVTGGIDGTAQVQVRANQTTTQVFGEMDR